MRLLVGGMAQGKLTCAMELVRATPEDVLYGESCPLTGEQNGLVLHGVQALVRRCMEAGEDPMALLEALLSRNPELIITARELGCGVVPMDAFQREWRERTGRVCCALAQRAQRVDRVVCGLLQPIKE